MIIIKPIAAFSDNYIWCIYDDETRQALVVDPGDAAPVQQFLNQQGLQLHAILITHHHFDHTGGIDSLLLSADVPVYGPHNEAIGQVSHRLTATDAITVLGLRFTVITIPGHTLDHIAYFCADAPTAPILLCGDTLFAGGCGRVFEGDAAMMHHSLQQLATLPAATRVYCAHEYTLANLAFAKAVEPNNQDLLNRLTSDHLCRDQGLPTLPSTIAKELMTNPFLRCQQPSVIDSARDQSGQSCRDTVAVFAAIRAWKDGF